MHDPNDADAHGGLVEVLDETPDQHRDAAQQAGGKGKISQAEQPVFLLREKNAQRVDLAHLDLIRLAGVIHHFLHRSLELLPAHPREAAEEEEIETRPVRVPRLELPNAERGARHDREDREDDGRQRKDHQNNDGILEMLPRDERRGKSQHDGGNRHQRVRLDVCHHAELDVMHPRLPQHVIEVRAGLLYFHG